MSSNQNLLPFLYFCNSRLFYRNIFLLITVAKREAILFLFGCSEVNSTWLITSELANQRARKALFTRVVYTNDRYFKKQSHNNKNESHHPDSYSQKTEATFHLVCPLKLSYFIENENIPHNVSLFRHDHDLAIITRKIKF